MISTKTKGYALGCIAAASYGLNPLFALPLYADGMTADSVLFWRYIVAVPLLALLIKMRGRSFAVTSRQALLLVVLGILVAVSSLALFLSYNFMDVGIASTMLFVYPIMVALIMACCFRERISPLTVGCIAVATAGIGLLFGHGSGDSQAGNISVWGTVLVMISALSYAIYIVAVNRSSLRNVATLAVTFYVLLFGVSLFLVRIFCGGGLQIPSTAHPELWGCIVGLAVFPTAISFACTTGAIQYIGSTPTAVLGALEPVTGVVIGVAVFGEHLSATSIIGLIMILGAVTLVIARPNVMGPLNHMRRLFPNLRRRKG